jgi:hypothetical protein
MGIQDLLVQSVHFLENETEIQGVQMSDQDLTLMRESPSLFIPTHQSS